MKGYDTEVRTHDEVARLIKMGRADVGLTLRFTAERYGLKSFHICWEKYDFVIRASRLSSKPVRTFISLVRSKGLKSILRESSGYDYDQELGSIIYRPRVQ